jgi:hypothetical protein
MTPRRSSQHAPIERDPPYVAVRFPAADTPSWGPQATQEVRERLPDDWAFLESQFPGLLLMPLFEGVPARVIRGLVARARQLSPSYQPADFLSLFQVVLPRREEWGPQAPEGPELATGLRRLMRERLRVVDVIVELHMAPPPASDDGGAHDLPYLDAPPRGIGIDVAAAGLGGAKVSDFAGGKGQGETLADVELGWDPTHKDFRVDAAGTLADEIDFEPLPGGSMHPTFVKHGTQVLSVAVARRNSIFTMGVAPLVKDVVLSSAWRTTASIAGVKIVEAAILEALVALVGSGRPAGSILLIEDQTPLDTYDTTLSAGLYGPSEVNPVVFWLIQLAVANHVVVVEATGNGSAYVGGTTAVDLDALLLKVHPDGKGGFKNSGAILVSAAQWDGSDWVEFSWAVKGARVDCFAQGDDAYAAVPGHAIANGFNSSSLAAAIVAGAALVLQGLVRNGLSGVVPYLTPMQMRALLGHKSHNTKLKGGVANVVGVMPRLAVLAEKIASMPDLYIRDHALDKGDAHTLLLARSPDIIVRNSQVTAAQANTDWGEGSGAEDRDDLSEVPVAGQKAWVYVRVRNRSAAAAAGATVKVWYADSTTILDFAKWKEIGQATLDVPGNDQLTVSAAIEWSAVPATGHYCFIALVHHADDPGFVSSSFLLPSAAATLTIPAEFTGWSYFRNYVRTENNVSWRNFDVVDVSAAAASVVTVEADVGSPPDGGGGGGAGGGGGDMELNVENRLPPGASLEVEMPDALAKKLKRLHPAIKLDLTTKTWKGPVPNGTVVRLGAGKLSAKSSLMVKLHVKLPAGLARAGEVALVQREGKDVVGRVTRRFRPK